MGKIVIYAAATFVVAAVTAGCGPTDTTRPAESTTTVVTQPSTTRPVESTTAAITQPGKVLVDHDTRRRQLQSGSDELCWASKWNVPQSAIPPVVGVLATEDDLDERYFLPGRQMRELGAACLKLEGAPCQTIVDTMLAWAKADAAINRSGKESDEYFTSALTINLDMAKPFVGAYAIARATVPVAPEEDAAIRRWMRKVLAGSDDLMGTDQNAAIHLYTHERACPEARSARGRGVSNNARARQRPWISAVSARADSRAA